MILPSESLSIAVYRLIIHSQDRVALKVLATTLLMKPLKECELD